MTDRGAAQIATGAAQDLADVMLVMREAFDPAFGEAWTEAQCAGIMGMPGTWLLLARDDGAPAGFALARTIGDESELLLLAVRPSWRRRGIGAKLLRAVIDEVRSRGVRSLHLEVRASNSALGLYRAAGFKQIGVRRDYYRGKNGELFDALTYKLDIPQTN